MFDPFDQVRMRTQQLLASADRIRQERALGAAAHEPTVQAAASVLPKAAEPGEVAALGPCLEAPATPDASRSRAA